MIGVLIRGNLDTDMYRGKMTGSHRDKTDIYQPRGETWTQLSLWPQKKPTIVYTLISDFWPPEL